MNLNRPESDWYNRWRSVRHLAVAAFLVTAMLVFIRFNYDGEALTSDEMLSRYDYDVRELSAAIGKFLSPLHNRDRRWDLQERWLKELKRHSQAERLRIRRQAIRIALAESVRTAALLPPEERQSMAAMLAAQARELRGGEDTPPVDSDELQELLQALPAEQRELWEPVTAEWLRLYPVEQW